jgi:NADH-quinone oxidoreductase subunit C
MMITVTKNLADHLAECFAGRIEISRASNDQIAIQVPVEQWLDVAQTLRDDPRFDFNQMTDLCGVDYLGYGQSEWDTKDATHEGFSRGVEGLGPGRFDWQSRPESDDVEQRFCVVVHLLSISNNLRISMATFAADEGLPVVPSLIEVWNSADWYEREAFDLFGIVFEGHPDLRRLLTDYGFTGHPFRKDFPLIGNVTVRYDEEKERVVYEPVEIEPRVLVPRVIREDSRYKADDIDKAAEEAADSLANGAD